MALLGARYHTLAADFIAKIETVPAVPDPDPERARDTEEILRNMRQINRAKGCCPG